VHTYAWYKGIDSQPPNICAERLRRNPRPPPTGAVRRESERGIVFWAHHFSSVLLFPDGRLPSPRWRVVYVLVMVMLAGPASVAPLAGRPRYRLW